MRAYASGSRYHGRGRKDGLFDYVLCLPCFHVEECAVGLLQPPLQQRGERRDDGDGTPGQHAGRAHGDPGHPREAVPPPEFGHRAGLPDPQQAGDRSPRHHRLRPAQAEGVLDGQMLPRILQGPGNLTWCDVDVVEFSFHGTPASAPKEWVYSELINYLRGNGQRIGPGSQAATIAELFAHMMPDGKGDELKALWNHWARGAQPHWEAPTRVPH
ncbi:uncharacterized protein LOC112344216 [Selaginella moellendorffii]|uniref:uncharacterized protein LOC112344216 n=1 Tax=Selaginella moellendorffii TaxID=88036 RepID=UPI000D1CAA57|nr:uncharacterized protein LOC112344216 [Selaginella moellendorffii]|eukprot:XP_024524302.1 uncharacterized protein LOC112344216 [Selaginella moellendorffii]